MKNLIEKKWRFIFCMHLLLFWTCSKIEDNTVRQGSDYTDPLLSNAVDSFHRQSFDVVLKKLKDVIEQAESVGDGHNQVLGTINLGNLYLFYNADEEALNYFFLSLDLARQFKTDELLNTIYNNIGIVYSNNNDFKKSEDFFSEALAISRERNEPKRIAINLINLGNLKEQEKNVDQAKIYYQEAQEIFQMQNDTANLAAVMNNIGNIFFQNENYTEAKSYYQIALQLSENQFENFYLPFFHLNYGKTFFQFEDYDSSLFYLHRSLDAFLMVKNTDKIIKSCNWLAKAYVDKGDHEKSIQFYNESLNWKDTLLNEKSQKWVSEIQMKYEFGKKEKEIEFLQKKSKQEKLIWGGVIFGLLVFSILLFYSVKVKNANLTQKNVILEKEQELANLEIAKKSTFARTIKTKTGNEKSGVGFQSIVPFE